MAPKNRKPTGKPSWSRILLSGDAGGRKSWAAAELSADERIGGMFWLEVGDGEDTADEYGLIPGVKYDIIEHDGTWKEIYEQLSEHWVLAKKAEEAGGLRIALTVDAMSGIHSMLQSMLDTRARRKLANQLEGKGENPDLAWSSEREVTITPDLWNLARKRHEQFMSKVLTWPGPVVLISREKVATVFDAAGNLTKQKDWTLECRKDLHKQCTAWIRMNPGEVPLVKKLRSAKHGIMPDEDRAIARRDFTCANLIFDWVGCEPRESRAPAFHELDADQNMPDEEPAAQLRSQDALTAVKKEIVANGAALGWDMKKTLDAYGAEHGGTDIRTVVDLSALAAYRDDLKARAAQPAAAGPKAVADAPATEAGTTATDKILTQIQTLAKAMQAPKDAVERHFKAKHGKALTAGTEAELMTFRAEMQKNGIPAPVSPVRAVA